MLIALVGLPGSGKTTVGRQLARRLKLPFEDSDRAVEARLGCSIKEYFEVEGEDRFRDTEQQAVNEIVLGADCVLSTGGGAVLRPQNRKVLRERCKVFYLDASPEDLVRRLRHDTQRPLLQVADPLQKLRDLYAQRDPLYRETAHIVIETGRPSVGTLVNTILEQLDMAKSR